MDEKPAICHKTDNKEHLDAEAKKQLKKDCKTWEDLVARNMRLYILISGSDQKENSPVHHELNFLNKNVFPCLLECLIKVLEKTKSLDSFYTQRLAFNGIDYLTELLYNCNSRHPLRTKKSLLKIPFVKEWLKENPWSKHGRGVGWLESMAAIVIQAHLRGFMVRRRADVQEMRTFWKILKREKEEANRNNEQTECADLSVEQNQN